MAGGVDGDAGREVEEEVAVDVLDRQALAANRHDRVRPRQARRGPGLVEFDMRPRLRAGKLRDDVRHGTIPGDSRHGRQGPHLRSMHNEYADWIFSTEY